VWPSKTSRLIVPVSLDDPVDDPVTSIVTVPVELTASVDVGASPVLVGAALVVSGKLMPPPVEVPPDVSPVVSPVDPPPSPPQPASIVKRRRGVRPHIGGYPFLR
jgi:hypothetical protein